MREGVKVYCHILSQKNGRLYFLGDMASFSSAGDAPATSPRLSTSKSVVEGDVTGNTGEAALGESELAEKTKDFWLGHQRWENSVLATPLDIVVDSPEQVKSFASSYVQYSVKSNPMGYDVKRRYSDFTWLRETLARRYVGVLVPTLPEKGGLKFSNTKFIQLRMRSLAIFVERLVQNAYLKSDVSVMDFLSITDRKAFDAAKKAVKEKSYEATLASAFEGHGPERANVGEVKWREALDTYTLPENTERSINAVKLQIDSLEKVMEGVIRASSKVVERSEAYQREMGEFKVAFASMMLTEQGAQTNQSSQNRGALSNILQKMGSLFDRWHFVLKLEPIVNELLFHEVLKYELYQLRALRDLLKQRDAMIEAHQKASKLVRKKELDQQSLVTRGKDDKAQKMDEPIRVGHVNVKKCEYVVNFMTKGLFFSELDRFYTSKVNSLTEMMATFSAAQLSYSSKLNSIWTMTMDDIGGDAAGSATRANLILDRLGVLEDMEQFAASEAATRKKVGSAGHNRNSTM